MNNKGADQLAHPRNLISTFVVRYLDSILSLVSISEISIPWLASVAAQAGLCLTWLETPKTGFFRDKAHFVISFSYGGGGMLYCKNPNKFGPPPHPGAKNNHNCPRI